MISLLCVMLLSFLKKWGFLDFAGGIPIETASGWAALSGYVACVSIDFPVTFIIRR